MYIYLLLNHKLPKFHSKLDDSACCIKIGLAFFFYIMHYWIQHFYAF